MNTNVTGIRKEAEDIMKERTSQTVKREKLLSIGLTNSDIKQLFFAERLAKKIAKKERDAARQIMVDTLEQIFARYTFGVEIECYNVRATQLVDNATNRGLEMRREGYNHDDNDHYYKRLYQRQRPHRMCFAHPQRQQWRLRQPQGVLRQPQRDRRKGQQVHWAARPRRRSYQRTAILQHLRELFLS